MGKNIFDVENSDTTFDYVLYETVDSAGYLVGELPKIAVNTITKTNNNTKQFDNLRDIYLKAITAYVKKTSDNFAFHYPIVLESFMPNVITIFEGNLNIIIKDLGLSFFPRESKQTVIFKYLPNGRPFKHAAEMTDVPDPNNPFNKNYIGHFYFLININNVLNNDFTLIKKSLGITFLSYELTYSKNLDAIGNTIKSWAEELFTDSEFKYPENFDIHFMEPFYGSASIWR